MTRASLRVTPAGSRRNGQNARDPEGSAGSRPIPPADPGPWAGPVTAPRPAGGPGRGMTRAGPGIGVVLEYEFWSRSMTGNSGHGGHGWPWPEIRVGPPVLLSLARRRRHGRPGLGLSRMICRSGGGTARPRLPHGRPGQWPPAAGHELAGLGQRCHWHGCHKFLSGSARVAIMMAAAAAAAAPVT